MSRLAPGRTYDMNLLLEKKAKAIPYTDEWDRICIRIEHLIWEGKDQVLCDLRERLVGAARASDNDEIIKISKQIDKRVKQVPRPPWLRKVK